MSERKCKTPHKNKDIPQASTHISDFLKFLREADTIYAIAKEKENRFYVKRTDIVQRTLQEHEKNGKEEAT